MGLCTMGFTWAIYPALTSPGIVPWDHVAWVALHVNDIPCANISMYSTMGSCIMGSTWTIYSALTSPGTVPWGYESWVEHGRSTLR